MTHEELVKSLQHCGLPQEENPNPCGDCEGHGNSDYCRQVSMEAAAALCDPMAAAMLIRGICRDHHVSCAGCPFENPGFMPPWENPNSKDRYTTSPCLIGIDNTPPYGWYLPDEYPKRPEEKENHNGHNQD